MTDLRLFLGLLKITEDAATTLGLETLTPSDRLILSKLWEHFGSQDNAFEVGPEFLDLLNESHGKSTSRAQLYKSLRKLEDNQIIFHTGSPRSKKYVFAQQ
jgi:hypothetical protein